MSYSHGLFIGPDDEEIIPALSPGHKYQSDMSPRDPCCRVCTRERHADVHQDPKPFHVFIHGKGYIEISCLVWARSEKEAGERVVEAARIACEKHEEGGLAYGRARRILDWEARGCKMDIEPFDTRRIACEVNWASNGGIAH